MYYFCKTTFPDTKFIALLMILLAVLFPALSFLLRGRIISGVLCILLQVTLIGWLPAAIWAVTDLQNRRAERRTRRIIRAMR